eukprot:jgi/Ulvmu1/1022/UM104_0007.1
MVGSAAKRAGEQGQHPECWSPASKLPLRTVRCGHVFRNFSEQAVDGLVRCQTCGHPLLADRDGRCVRDYVPSATLSWDSICTKTVIRPQRQEAREYTYERMLAELAGDTQLLDLSTRTLWPQRLPQPADSFLVWRAAPAGCTVRQGSIGLPQDGVLLLAGHGAAFHGTTFTGGVLMCTGPDFAGTFTRCTFEQCTLYAVAGARVTLRSCRFLRSTPAVVASGAATAAQINSCLFHSCRAGVIADQGANVTLRESAIVESTAAVIVNEAGSHAELAQSSVLIRMRAPSAACVLMRALVVGPGGSARVRECHIDNIPFPVAAQGPAAKIELHSTRIINAVAAIHTDRRARIAMHDVDLTTNGAAPSTPSVCAIQLADIDGHARMGGVIQLHRCSIHAKRSDGLQALNGGLADVLLCTLRSYQPAVTALLEGSSVHVTHSTLTAQEGACLLGKEAATLCFDSCTVSSGSALCADVSAGTLSARDTLFRGGAAQPQPDVMNFRGCKALMLRCRVEGSMAGIRACHSTVRVVDSDFAAGPQRGVRGLGTVQAPPSGAVPVAIRATASVLAVRGGTVRAFEYGVLAVHADCATASQTELDGVCFEGCHFCVMFGAGASGTVRKCRFIGCDMVRAREVNVELAQGGAAEVFPAGVLYTCGAEGGAVEGCEFDGPWLGVEANADTPVTVRDCVFRCTRPGPWRWVCVSVVTEAAVEGCEISGARPGIEVYRCAKAAVKRCRIETEGSAVMLRPQSHVTMLDCTLQGGSKGVFLAEGSRLVAQDCSCMGVVAGLVTEGSAHIAAKRVTVQATTACVMTQCTRGGSSEVKLVDCKLRGGDAAAMFQYASVSASLLRCEVSDAGIGVCAVGSCSLRIRNSIVRDCKVGIGVGADYGGLTRSCMLCGHSGASGHARAMTALQSAHSTQRDAGALCAHAGAVTRAVLEDVSVERCKDGGLAVCAPGHVVATRLHAVRCDIDVDAVAERSRFEDCTVTEGQKAVCAWERPPGDARRRPPEKLQGVRVVPCGDRDGCTHGGSGDA